MSVPELPRPILFHPLKHHVLYLQHFTRSWQGTDEEVLKAMLRTIGSSQLDLYLGRLTVRQIAEETLLYLDTKSSLSPEAYRLYLSGSGQDYQTVTLSDGSIWVLRWGVAEGRHVHLHPARYSPYTIRVKANILKTAVAACIAMVSFSTSLDLQLINQVRARWLELAPLKHFAVTDQLNKIIQLIAPSAC